jgi:hypothetical protein
MLSRVALAGLLALATVAVVVILATFVLTARRDLLGRQQTAVSSPPAEQSPLARPSGVPATAELVVSDVAFGEVSLASGADPQSLHLFYSLACRDDLLVVPTTHETIYAELPCHDYWLPDDVVRPFLGKPVRVRISTEPPPGLVIDASSAGSARFTADRVWIEGH